jgi:phage terminase large subunit
VPDVQIPARFLPFLKKPKRFKAIFGGRGSGKTQNAAKIDVIDARTKGVKTACFREYQNTIDDSSYAVIKSEIQGMQVPGFEIQQRRILMDGEDCFIFRGLARNPEGVKSLFGFNRAWVDEAQTLSDESLKMLTPTFREPGSELWFTANLRSIADPFSQRFFVPFQSELRATGFYEDDLHMIAWVNYSDNPFFPDDLEQERLFDLENKSRALYRHVWEGEPYDEVEDSIIPVEWFDAAIDAHVKLGYEPEGAIVAAHDPADSGDAKGYALRHGVVFLDVDEMSSGDGADGCAWAIDKALAAGADWFIWDGDGMGVLLKPQIARALDGKRVDYAMHKGSEGVDNPEADYLPTDTRDPVKRKKNKESLLNKRAQSWMDTARRFHNTYLAVEKGVYIDPLEQISLSSKINCIDKLRSEICRIPRKSNNSGKIQIMSKKEMEGLGIPSPNMGDSVNMASYFTPVVGTPVVKLNFKGWGR